MENVYDHMSELELLRDLVSIRSPFPEEKKIGEFVERLLKKNGFKTSRDYLEKGRFNVLAEKGKNGPALLFYGHIDTVPLYGTWRTNPLKLTQDGDRLYGLGTHDMKAGVAVILDAAIKSNGKHIKLLFCADEENISKGAWTTVRRHKKWFNDVKVAVTGEAGVTDENDGGVGVVTLGRRGRCVIGVEVKGRSSHGAEPEKGVSALEQAAKIALNINKIERKYHKKLGRESIFISEIRSVSTSLSVPQDAYVEFDIHLVPPSNSADARDRVERYIRGLARSGVLNPVTKTTVYVKKRETPYLDPYITDDKNRYVNKIIALSKEHAGKLTKSYGLSVADENVLAVLGIPVVTIGPKGGNEHSANEWVSKRSLRETAKLFDEMIEKL